MRRMEKETDYQFSKPHHGGDRIRNRLIISFQSLIMVKTEEERETGWLLVSKPHHGRDRRETDNQTAKSCRGQDRRRKRPVDYWFSKPHHGEDRRDWLSIFKALSWWRQKKETGWLLVFKALRWRRQKREWLAIGFQSLVMRRQKRDWLTTGFQSLIMEKTEERDGLIIMFQSLVMDETEGERDWLLVFKASTSTQVISGKKRSKKHHTQQGRKKSLPRRHHGGTHTTPGKCWKQWCGRSPQRWCRLPPHGQRSGTNVAASSAVLHRGASSPGDKTHTVYTCSLLFPWQQLASQHFLTTLQPVTMHRHTRFGDQRFGGSDLFHINTDWHTESSLQAWPWAHPSNLFTRQTGS